MFEVWESVDDPAQRLVFRESASFPGAFAVREWRQLGVCRVAGDIETEVDRDGYVVLSTAVPVDLGEVLQRTAPGD